MTVQVSISMFFHKLFLYLNTFNVGKYYIHLFSQQKVRLRRQAGVELVPHLHIELQFQGYRF